MNTITIYGPKKGVEFKVLFTMVDSTDFNTPETGIDTTQVIDKDDAGFGACTNAESEIGNGAYSVVLTATEMTADRIVVYVTGAGCAPLTILIYTVANTNEDIYGRLGAPAGASISADIAENQTDLDAVLVDTGNITAKLPSKDYLMGTDTATGALDSDSGDVVADEVWEEDPEEHVGDGTYGGLLYFITILLAAISDKLPTNYIMGSSIAGDKDGEIDSIHEKLPSKSYLRGTNDSDGGMDTEDKADINAACDAALTDYDPPTKAELDTAETNIIAEVDANEAKIDTIDTNVDSILTKIVLIFKAFWNKKKLVKEDDTHFREYLYDDDDATEIRDQYLVKESDTIETREKSTD